MKQKRTNSLMKGTMILATAALTSKFLGFFYKFVLARLIEDTGMGIYEKVYPIYTTILTISIVGVPVAISKLVAEKKAEDKEYLANHIFQVALKFSFVFGLLATTLLFILARPLALVLDDLNTYYSILAIAPAVLVVSIMASFRGYFQGQQRMIPTAISQVVEQFIRIITMITLAYLLLPWGVEFGAAGATSGAFFGALAGLAVIYIFYFRKERFKVDPSATEESLPTFKEVLVKIFNLAVPVSLGALIVPVMRLIDALMITRRLRVAEFSLIEATALFGQFNGMAMTLVRFPTVIAGALAVSLVPAISEADAVADKTLLNNRIAKAFKLTIFISLPSVVGLFILAEPLCRLIFNNAQAAIPLRFLAFGVVSISLQQMTSSILQGFNYPKLPAINLFAGAFVNMVLNYFLTAVPALNIRGAAIGTISGFTVAAALNIYHVFKLSKPDFDYHNLLYKPFLSSLLMGGLVYYTYSLLTGLNFDVLALISAVFVGMISYFILLLISKGLVKEDIKAIPYIGDKIVAALFKLGMVK